MLIQTHKIIATNVHEYVNKQLNINLNKKLLIYGAMKPDIMPRLAIKKHYQEESFDFVIDEILTLITSGLYENNISVNKFSVRLGVISHFLSDFFCLPHYNREYYHDKLVKHIKYEKKLHAHFENFNGLNKVNVPYIDSISKQNIKDFIEKLHEVYKLNDSGFANDIKGSINISCAISNLILEHSLLMSENKLVLF